MSQARSILKALRRARRRVIAGWCQRALACDASLQVVDVRCASARAWCIEGSINAVAAGILRVHAIFELEMSLRGRWFERGLAAFNDADKTKRGHVLALIDRTIERVRVNAEAGVAVGAPPFEAALCAA